METFVLSLKNGNVYTVVQTYNDWLTAYDAGVVLAKTQPSTIDVVVRSGTTDLITIHGG